MRFVGIGGFLRGRRRGGIVNENIGIFVSCVF